MHALTDTAAGLMLDWFGNIGTPTRPSAFYAALHSGPPGAAGASNELSGNGYVRKAFTPERSSRTLRNAGAITFDAVTTSAWAEVLFASVWSAESAGTCYLAGPLSSALARAFVLDNTTSDVILIPGHGWSDGDRVYLRQFSGLSLPTGLTKDTVYYVVNSATDQFQLEATEGGGAVAISGKGVGTLQKITNARTAQVGDVVQFAAQTLTFQLPAAG